MNILIILLTLFLSCSKDRKSNKTNSSLQELLREKTTQEIAKTLIKKLSEQKNLDNESKVPSAQLRTSIISLAFKEKYLDDIINTGEFLNAHQVQNSSFNDDLKERATVEDLLINAPLSEFRTPQNKEKIAELRPKYSFLINNQPLFSLPESKINSEYGNILAVMKDQVKERSTFTIGDSLDLKDPKYLNTFYLKKTPLAAKNEVPYWEAQIWGKLTLEDVDYFLINCQSFPRLQKESILKLLKITPHVYKCLINKEMDFIRKGFLFDATRLDDYISPIKDETSPKLIRTSMDFNEVTSKFTLQAKDESRLNFCQIVVHKDGSKIFQKDQSISDRNDAKCAWNLEIFKEIGSKYQFTLVVEDIHGNKNQKNYHVPKKGH